ncbi:TspO/MBR family protein [Tautonia plasticadhaerens]|uniref:TspO/MBR family protein n=1 Tax=Tautonia plasticadhaerens TaxID=2527974 RepID=A0A518GZA6_9BACT|nr:TspO/MBR family protein [Tautonia plasticadhaerens]QDV33935.1 TspO/MBR family protein [Tautonia plasticadhaerens]
MTTPEASASPPGSPGRDLLALVGFLALCFSAAGVGGWLTARGLGAWYDSLRKPSWNPPGAVFGPVWTLLYASMAVAAWLAWRRSGWAGARGALLLFGLQLVLNVAWSGLFFGLRRPDLALLEIAALWLAILATLVAFARVRPLAGWLMAPYLLWVTFATALNFALWRLNAP